MIRCPGCSIPNQFIHDGWTPIGRPHFLCLHCREDWTTPNKDGKPYCDYAVSHPETIKILGWTEEDYRCYNLRLENNIVIFERKSIVFVNGQPWTYTEASGTIGLASYADIMAMTSLEERKRFLEAM
jgi:hypothetical protein